MATAIGDLVVTLGVENQQFISALNTSGANLDEFATHMRGGGLALDELGKHEEEAEGHVGGASRAFNFLGKQIKEAGEGLGEHNAALGETVSGLGSTVSGLGEAVHGFHALHTAIEVATASQVFFNSISPMGWAIMAGGIAAAAGAYLFLGRSAEESEPKVKSLEEIRKDATKGADSELENLQKRVEQLDYSPLELFRHEMEQTGRSSSAIEEATHRFETLSAAIERHKSWDESRKTDAELARRERDAQGVGVTEGGRFAAGFSESHPGATTAQNEFAKKIGEEMDAKSLADKQRREADAEQLATATRLHAELKSLTEGPFDRLIDQAKEFREGLARGAISKGDFTDAMHGLQAKAQEMEKSTQPDKSEAPKSIEFGTAAAFEELYKAAHPDEQLDHAKATADNTAKMKELLELIHDGIGKNPFNLM